MIKLLDHLGGGAIAGCLFRRKISRVPVLTNPQRVMVIRPGGIGDAVFLLPVLRALKEQGHAIDVLCEKRNAEIFLSQPGLCHKVFRYDVFSEFLQVFQSRYDMVIDSEQWHNSSAIVAYFLKGKIRIGFSTRSSRSRLFDRVVPYDPHSYELTCLARLVEDFRLAKELILPGACHVSGEDREAVKAIVPDRYVVLALGGSIPGRRFTPEQAGDVCLNYTDKGLCVILVGGKDVADLGREVWSRMAGRNVRDLSGKLSLRRTMAVIAGAERFIGHDSGLLHVAVAVGVPVVGIFGPGNKVKWGPRGPRDEVLASGLDCSPCTRFGYTLTVCRGEFPCIRKMSFTKK